MNQPNNTFDRPRLEARLKARRKALRAEVAAQLTAGGDDRSIGLRNRLEDTDDWSVADVMADLDIAEMTRDVHELADVEAALERIADGSYGTCVDCGVAIAPARLSAWPTAKRCIACQEIYERKIGGPEPASL